MEIGMQETVKVNAKTLKIYLKVCDQFSCGLYSESGKQLKDYEGYVPRIMPGEHCGDYVDLEIDIDTGMILNWKKLTSEDIEEFINVKSEE
jgi:hypothetical protein